MTKICSSRNEVKLFRSSFKSLPTVKKQQQHLSHSSAYILGPYKVFFAFWNFHDNKAVDFVVLRPERQFAFWRNGIQDISIVFVHSFFWDSWVIYGKIWPVVNITCWDVHILFCNINCSHSSNSLLSYGCNLWCRTKQKFPREPMTTVFPWRIWMENVLCHEN